MSSILKKQNIFWLIAILLLIIIVVGVLREITKDGVFSLFRSNKSEPVEVSMINLISDPQKYDGRIIRVKGIGSVKFENSAIYLSKDDYRFSNLKNAIWLDFNSATFQTDENMQKANNGKYVIVEGIFNKDNNGLNNSYSGTIEKISRYELSENIIRE